MNNTDITKGIGNRTKSWQELEEDILKTTTKDDYEKSIKEVQEFWEGKKIGLTMSREAAIYGVADLFGINKTKEGTKMEDDLTYTEGEIEEKNMTDGKKKDGEVWERVSFKVSGHTYSSFDPKYKEFMKGETVRIGFKSHKDEKTDRTYYTIGYMERIARKAQTTLPNATERTENAQGTTSYWLSEATRKNRCVALNCAISVYNALPEKDDIEWITTTAESFAEWLSKGETKTLKDINTNTDCKVSEEIVK